MNFLLLSGVIYSFLFFFRIFYHEVEQFFFGRIAPLNGKKYEKRILLEEEVENMEEFPKIQKKEEIFMKICSKFHTFSTFFENKKAYNV